MATTNHESSERVAEAADRRRRYVVAVVLTGFVGSILVALASVSTGALPVNANPSSVPILGWLSELPTVALTIALVGMGLLVTAWLALARFAHPGCRKPLASRRMYQTLIAWGVPLAVVPPLFSRDVYSYIAQGAIADRGLDPYVLGPGQALGHGSVFANNVSDYWVDTPAPYGPVFVNVERAITAVAGSDPLVAVLLHRVVALVGLGLIVWALRRLAARTGVGVSRALWLGALNPLVLFHLIAGVHNEALMVGLMGAGIALIADVLPVTKSAVSSTRPRGPALLVVLCGIVLITLAANVKLTAAAALAVVAAMLARAYGGKIVHLVGSAFFVLTAAGLGTVVVSFAGGFGFDWVGAVSTQGAVNSWMAPTNQVGFLVGGVGSLFGADITQAAIGTGRLIGAIIALIVGAKLLWEIFRGRIGPLLGLGLLLTIAVVFAPAVQAWYLLWIVVPLAACLRAGKVWNILVGAVAVFAVLVPPTGASFVGRIGSLVVAYGIAIVIVSLVILMGRRMLAVSRS